MSVVGTSPHMDQRAQPAGVPATDRHRGGLVHAAGTDAFLLDLHAQLCELVPDPDGRVALLRIPVAVDAAWSAGRMLPVLRAHRKPLVSLVARLQREAAPN